MANLANRIEQLITVIAEIPSLRTGNLTVRQTERIMASLRDVVNDGLEQRRDTSAPESSRDADSDSDSGGNSSSGSVIGTDLSTDESNSESVVDSDAYLASISSLSRDTLERCTAQHVPRRRIDDNCPICTEPMSRRRLGDLVWCKSQCGKSVHRSCFESWHAYSTGTTRCVHW